MIKLEIKKVTTLSFALPIFLTLQLGFFALNSFTPKNIPYSSNFADYNDNNYIFYFLPFCDTLYYLGDYYLVVNLKLQKAYLFFRNGEIDSFPISSGNPNLHKGISTPTGLFAVQNKSPIQISRQFENTEMINWIGFNGNIGFHGLKKKGYYFHLGKRPSSHGCVRISLEDAERVYKNVKIGTPVLVFENEPFRIIKFSNWNDYNPSRDYLVSRFDKDISKFFNNRQKSIFEGKFYLFGKERVFLTPKIKSIFSSIKVEGEKTVPIQKPVLFKLSTNETIRLHSLYVTKFKTIADTCPFTSSIFE